MKKKQKVDLVISIFLVLIGVALTMLAHVKEFDLEKVLFAVMMAYATLNMIQFVFTKESRDYEGLYTSILSYAVGVCGLAFDLFNNLSEMVVTLFSWVVLMSLIKFKKCDYYHDRNNKMWIVRIVTLILFILTGIITCINLYFTKDVQILIIGLFFYIHGILEMTDPLTVYLMGVNHEDSK